MNGVAVNQHGDQRGMHSRGRTRGLCNAWKGGRYQASETGYVMLFEPENPRSSSKGYVAEHVAIAERTLGKPLPPDAVVHHVDRNPANNTPSNLVVCQDQAYHMILHRRQRALDACGNAAWRRCTFCKQYDAASQMSHHGKSSMYHPECRRANRRARAERRGRWHNV